MHSSRRIPIALIMPLCLAGLALAPGAAGQTPQAGEQVTDAERIQWLQHD
ncbi:MAG: hypothetical protein P4L40_01625 [Terracidiphilus sp.]|nr:hypothetical protein [Terracidiphilus sp.]